MLLGPLVLLVTSLVAIAVGVRLLAIARRTRGVPETAIAVGFLAIYLVGMPISGVSRIPALVGTPLGDVLIGLGLAAIACGMLGFYVFAWRTFRPRARWAAALVVAAGIALAASSAHVVLVIVRAAALGTPAIHTAARLMLVPMGLAFLWMAIESLGEYARARRRLQIGLSDPVAANRLLLWGTASAASLLTISLVFGVLTGGRGVFQIPFFQVTMSISNAVTGCCWWLAFLPPRSFLGWVRAGAAQQAE